VLLKVSMSKLVWDIPITTVSEANCSEHWAIKSKRHKQQQFFVRMAMSRDIKQVSLPCHIKLTRIASRSLDYDNLVSSQKWVLDAVCDLLVPGLRAGRADGDKRISASYFQEKGKLKSIKIEIEF
jgi:hypothetical protein